ncbi:hypothetical protein HIM_12555 [Hirsutella minnesotensis 3608]|uniref:tyrosinase n=1 Tax=Hirsutella minnesotensis 3608 TaxID=1043627 RepID=A0A0F7ZHW4_9HYPO|nr:hypothetical protein HIM_12555 [Hirsutella minnesotensis 3608]
MIKTLASYLFLGSAVLVHAQQSASDPFPVIGVQVQSGSVPVRRNINDLQSEAGPQWDLYIQALSSMIGVGPSDPLSYFQIEGIHGYPALEWNNTGSRNNNGWEGYCPHGEALFLAWHRPYLVLFEASLITQLLVDHARRIASEYQGAAQTQYLQAAEQLRAPYWDWAASSDVPPSTVPPTITVNTAQGSMQVNNPLSGYTFPQEAVRGDFGQFSPNPSAAIDRCPSPDSYPSSANEGLRSNNLSDMVYNAFAYSQTFEQFSTTSGGGLSIEQAHNLVHNSAACGQQFSTSEYAAFDPLFMMHHANVDRLWALWQASKPDEASLSRPYAGGSRFSTPEGTMISSNSPLPPFFGQGRVAYTPDTVTSTQQFGYTYEGLENPVTPVNRKRDGYAPHSHDRRQNDVDRRRRAIAKINELYRGKSHDKGGNVYLAHINYRAEDIERPSRIQVYLCDQFVGDIAVMSQPSKGSLSAALSLNNAFRTCLRAGVTPDKIQDKISVKITTAHGKDIPLDAIKTITTEVENFDETPPASPNELPKIGNRRRVQGRLRPRQP